MTACLSAFLWELWNVLRIIPLSLLVTHHLFAGGMEQLMLWYLATYGQLGLAGAPGGATSPLSYPWLRQWCVCLGTVRHGIFLLIMALP